MLLECLLTGSDYKFAKLTHFLVGNDAGDSVRVGRQTSVVIVIFASLGPRPVTKRP